MSVEAVPLIGQLLDGRYRVESRLGRGGMANVYLATDTQLNLRVVVKVPQDKLLEMASFRERFRREIESQLTVSHPNIVRVLSRGEHDARPYFVCPFLSGGSLSDRIARAGGKLSAEAVLGWLPTIASTLDKIRKKKLIHRDVKPDNILFDEDGHAFVSDFGIACVLREIDETVPQGDSLTVFGGAMLTPAYAPPEAFNPVSIRTPKSHGAYDQYSLAASVYEALDGRPPVDASKAPTAPRPLEAPGLPSGARRAVMRALSWKPEDRFESCEQFARAFAQEVEAAARRRRRRFAVVGVAAAVIAGLLIRWPTDGTETTDSDPQTSGASEGRVDETTTFFMGSTDEEKEEALRLCRSAGIECDPAWYASETYRRVEIGPIEMDPFEVTNEQFARFVAERGYRTEAEARGYSFDGQFKVPGLGWREANGAPNAPVVHVSARDAEAYCRAVGRRLPSEAEWEFAARGDERRFFPWGDEWSPSRATGKGLEFVGSHPAGATPEGVQDMAGSVWEWTSSVPDGEPGARILKGGSFRESNPANFRPAAQMIQEAEESGSDIGFRCVSDVSRDKEAS